MNSDTFRRRSWRPPKPRPGRARRGMRARNSVSATGRSRWDRTRRKRISTLIEWPARVSGCCPILNNSIGAPTRVTICCGSGRIPAVASRCSPSHWLTTNFETRTNIRCAISPSRTTKSRIMWRRLCVRCSFNCSRANLSLFSTPFRDGRIMVRKWWSYGACPFPRRETSRLTT
jgi:hypothetical protein